VADKDTEDFLDLLCVVRAGVVEECVAVGLSVCAEVFSVFLVTVSRWYLSGQVASRGAAEVGCKES
jgi:hypothetical protein